MLPILSAFFLVICLFCQYIILSNGCIVLLSVCPLHIMSIRRFVWMCFVSLWFCQIPVLSTLLIAWWLFSPYCDSSECFWSNTYFPHLRTTINWRSLIFVTDEVVGSTLTLQKSKLELTFYGAKINLKAKVLVFLFKKIIKYAPLWN